MRSPLRLLTGLGLHGLIVLSGWVAVFLMAAWGVAYVRTCLSILASPGVPVEFPFQGSGGEYIARGEDVILDPIGGRVLLGRASLAEKNGPEVARARKVQVAFGGPAIRIRADELDATLERDSTGELNVARVIPKEVPGQKAPLLEATVGMARVKWVDRFGGPPVTLRVAVREAMLSQGPDDTFVRGHLALERAPEGRFAYQGSTDGSQWVWLDQPAFDVTGLLPALRRVVPAEGERDLGRLRAAGLVFGGDLEVSRKGKEGEWDVRGVASLAGDGVTYPGWLQGASVRSRLEGDLRRAKVSLETRESGRSLGFEGVAGASPSANLAGDVRLSVASTAGAWKPLRDLLPPNVTAQGVRFEGPVAVAAERVFVGGSLLADRLSFEGERLNRVSSQVGWDGRRFVFGQLKAVWQGQGVSGALAIEPESGRLQGFATAKSVSIQDVISKYQNLDLYGSMDTTVLVSGKTNRPELSFLVRGTGRYGMPRGGSVPLDSFVLHGRLDGDVLDLQRAQVRSRGGIAAATGRLPLKSGKGRIEFASSALPLAQFTDAGEGSLRAQGVLTGTVAEWRAQGTVELTNGRIGELGVPLASARFSGTPDEILLYGAKAAVANGVAEGDVSWRAEGGALAGDFSYSGGSLAALSEGRVAGLVTLRNGVIGGTLESPSVTASASSDRIRFGEVLVRDVRAETAVRNGQAFIEGLQAKFGGGDVTGEAQMDLKAMDGLATFQVKDVDLGEVGAIQEDLEFAGKASGEGSARFGSNGLRSGQASLALRDVVFNDSLVGSGTASVAMVGSKVSGEVEIGTLDRYVDLRDVVLDLDSQNIDADLSAYNIDLETFVVATSRWSDDLPVGLQAIFRQSEGFMLASGHVGGKLDDPDITGGQLNLTGLSVRGRDFGQLYASFERREGAWEDVSLDWRAGDSALVAMGRYDAEGAIEGLIELSKFDLVMLQSLVPDTPNVRGAVESLTAVVGGSVDDPEATATMLLNVDGFTERDGGDVEFPVRAIFDEIGFDRRRARFRGQTYVKGFAGSAELTLPWSAFDEENLEREPIEGRLVFDERPIEDLKEFLTFLDMEGSVGTASAEASVSGFSQSIVIVGGGKVKADRLAFAGTSFAMKGAAFDFEVGREGATLTGQAQGEEGGDLSVDAKAAFSEPLRFGSALKETLTNAALTGEVKADALAGKFLLEGSQQPTQGELEANVSLEGTAGRPVLSGYAQATLLEAWLPEAIEEKEPVEIPDVLAFRRINLLVKSGSRVRSSTLDVYLGGSGTLDGSIAAPTLQLPLVLETGVLRMPTARVRLDPGGVADVKIENFGSGPVVRTTLDVSGRTQVTARRSSGQYDRFDVVLEVRGDALAPDGLILRARSEPPELTQEEIIALLGRTDLIRAFASGAAGGGFDSAAIRETIYGIALPSLTEGFLAQVAGQLRLDFVRFDYNPFDLFSVVIGKELGRGLLLQASRQLTQSATEPLKFDIRVVYRPPFRDRFLQQFRLSLGRNERVPWRATLDWSTRF